MVFEPEVIEKGKWISLICFGLFILLSGAGIYFLYRKRDKRQMEKI
jgi:cbb3-type cytochrome oxidase subunit 3